MKKRQENHHSRDLAVKRHMDDNNPIWAPNADIVAVHNDLNNRIQINSVLAGKQQLSTTGYATLKRNARAPLQLRTLSIAGRAKGWARLNNQPPLEALCDITPTALTRKRDTEIDTFATALKDAIAPHLAAMTTITAADLAIFGGLIHTYQTARDLPTTARASHTVITASLDNGLKATDELLDEVLLPLMAAYLETHPDFYATFRETMKIVDAGLRHEPEPPPPAPTP